MRHQPRRKTMAESRLRALALRFPPRGIPLLIAVLLAIPHSSDAQAPGRSSHAMPAVQTVVQVKPSQILPLHLPTELISTEYLRRALRDSQKRAEERVARRYAQRYRISAGLAQQIIHTSRAEGVDPELAFRLVFTESRFSPRARGPAGALGLTQLMPATARSVDPALRNEAAVLDPKNNLRVGFRYLRMMIEQFGDVRLGLLAYNRGETAVRRALRRGVDPENGYSHKVLGSRGDSRYRGPGLLNQ